jgi:hypothetical protein
MPAVEDVLAELATHPPAEPTPVGEIRGRARRRTRRRRAGAAAATALVLIAVGVGLGAAVTADDPGQDVVADGGTTTEEPTTTSPPPSVPVTVDVAAEATVVLDPATGFVDGSVVEMALAEPATGEAVVAQCAAEAQYAEGGVQLLSWCNGIVMAQADAFAPYTLSRTLETPAGTVDCAEVAGRCALGIRVGGMSSTDDRFAPLAFRADPPPSVEPQVDVNGDEGTVGDGDRMLITVTGVETDEVIAVQQCRTGVGCDLARVLRVSVQDGPETQLTYTAFHDVYGDTDPGDAYRPGWAACEPCELRVLVGTNTDASVRLPLVMEPTEAPVRPEVTLDPAVPHTWGQEVTVRAAGLQPSSDVAVGWCPTVPPQGGGGSACWSGQAASPRQYGVGLDGTLVIERFVLPVPDSFVGADCAVAGACGVGIDGGDPASVVAIAPLDLSG